MSGPRLSLPAGLADRGVLDEASPTAAELGYLRVDDGASGRASAPEERAATQRSLAEGS